MQELYDKTQAKKDLATMNAGVPWSKYKGLNNEKLRRPEELINKIIAVSKVNIKLAALFSAIYLTGSRINEILEYEYRGKNPDFKGIRKHGLRIKDIAIENDPVDNSDWWIMNTRVEKRRDVKGTYYKTSWSEYDEGNYCFPLIEILDNYIERVMKINLDEEQPLFLFKYRYAHKMIAKYLRMNPHFIRDLRARHLVNFDNFTPQDLKKFFGWTNDAMPMHYARSEESIIKNRLRKIT